MIALSLEKIDLAWAREKIPHFRELEKIAQDIKADEQKYRLDPTYRPRSS